MLLLAPHLTAPSASCQTWHFRTAQALRGRGDRPLGLHGGHGPLGVPGRVTTAGAGRVRRQPTLSKGRAAPPASDAHSGGRAVLLERNGDMRPVGATAPVATQHGQMRDIAVEVGAHSCQRCPRGAAPAARSHWPHRGTRPRSPSCSCTWTPAGTPPSIQGSFREPQAAEFLAWAACKGVPAEPCPGENTVRCCRGCGEIGGFGEISRFGGNWRDWRNWRDCWESGGAPGPIQNDECVLRRKLILLVCWERRRPIFIGTGWICTLGHTSGSVHPHRHCSSCSAA